MILIFFRLELIDLIMHSGHIVPITDQEINFSILEDSALRSGRFYIAIRSQGYKK